MHILDKWSHLIVGLKKSQKFDYDPEIYTELFSIIDGSKQGPVNFRESDYKLIKKVDEFVSANKLGAAFFHCHWRIKLKHNFTSIITCPSRVYKTNEERLNKVVVFLGNERLSVYRGKYPLSSPNIIPFLVTDYRLYESDARFHRYFEYVEVIQEAVIYTH